MNEQELEKLIAAKFETLPKKMVLLADREAAWQKVQNHIRVTKRVPAGTETGGEFMFWPRAIFRVATTVLVVIVALFVARGAVNAEPGETLYQVKLAAESVEKALATNNEAKAKVTIKHAKRRLAEVKTLVQQNKDPKVVQQTLDALKTTTEEVVEVVSISEIKPELTREAQDLATEQQQELSKVESTAGPEVKDAVASAITATKDSLDSLNKLASQTPAATAPSDVKGETTVADEDSDSKTVSKQPVRLKVKKNPALKDAPVDAGIQIGDVVQIGDDNEPKPIEE